MDRIPTLDLFSGIGGISLAIEPWCRTVAYCENDPYAQGVLQTRMASNDLDTAPIWDDVRTLRVTDLPERVELIAGGFPCQDLSVAGNGRGLDGERSGLFWQVYRLAKEVRPAFLFLENVPAIRTRGAAVVISALADLGYDCRWDVLSASDVGAPHKRDRWWLLAHATSLGRSEGRPESTRKQGRSQPARGGCAVGDADISRLEVRQCERKDDGQELSPTFGASPVGNAYGDYESSLTGFPRGADAELGGSGVTVDDAMRGRHGTQTDEIRAGRDRFFNSGWWAAEPDVGRVAHGIPKRVDRVRCLGNSVVPACAREAFQRLAGLKGP